MTCAYAGPMPAAPTTADPIHFLSGCHRFYYLPTASMRGGGYSDDSSVSM